MLMEDINSKIEALAKTVIEAKGMELIELKVAGCSNDVLIQIIADKPSGGITMGECAILNKSLVAAIEQESFLPSENFSLELSSPGLDRPLVTRKDFMRFLAQELHIWLNEPVEGKKEVQGRLAEVAENSLIVEVMGSRLVLPLTSVIRGMLVIE